MVDDTLEGKMNRDHHTFEILSNSHPSHYTEGLIRNLGRENSGFPDSLGIRTSGSYSVCATWWSFSVLTASCVLFFLDLRLSCIPCLLAVLVAIKLRYVQSECEPSPDMAYSVFISFWYSAEGKERALNTWREQITKWNKPLGEIFICFNFPSQGSWVWGSKRIVKIFFLDMGKLQIFSIWTPLLHDPLRENRYCLLFHLHSSKNFSDTASLNTDYVSFFFF